MSTSKKSFGKRKRQSPPPSTMSHIGRRLEKLRNGKRNLWDDDDNGEEEEVEQDVQSKNRPKTPIDNTYIVVTDDSDNENQRRSRSKKSKKKSSRIQDENLSSDNDSKMKSKCPTCLICSILSTLTSYNCCSNHLSLLKYDQNSSRRHHHHQQKHTTNSNQWPPQQVMIVPMTDEVIQRYFNPQEMHRLRTRTSTSPVYKKSTESKRSTRKLSKKSTVTSEASDTEQTNVPKPKSSTKSTHMEMEEISSSSSIIDSSLPNAGTIPADVTYTVVSSTSATSNSFESPSTLNTGQLQQSSDQPIVIDDSQPDSQQENAINENTQGKNKQNDPWTPISDETYAAIETALQQVEFTPALARRIPTELMAARLPKIQLKKGRYHRGKPIADKSTTSITTDESCSMNISQSSSTSSASVIITNTRPPSSPSLATIVEDEPVIIQSTCQNSEKSSQSCQILSERHDNTPHPLSDTVMSSLLAQDESSQHDVIHTTMKPKSNEALPALETIMEESARENDSHKSVDISQSSQLTNDQNDTNPLISSTTADRPTTPARISFRLNPDGSRISVSRPPLSSTHQQSPTRSSRRTSTDTTHANK